jgi:hypothetical protein
VRHSASTTYLSSPQSSNPVEKITQYLRFSNFSIVFLTGFQFLSHRLYALGWEWVSKGLRLRNLLFEAEDEYLKLVSGDGMLCLRLWMGIL